MEGHNTKITQINNKDAIPPNMKKKYKTLVFLFIYLFTYLCVQ